MTLQLYDLGQIVTITAASMASVMYAFQWLRDLFLDRLTQGMDAKQQDTLYRTLLWCLLTVVITVLAMLNYYSLSLTLVVSAAAAAFPLLAGVHFVYTRLQKKKKPQVPVADYPPGIPANSDGSSTTSAILTNTAG